MSIYISDSDDSENEICVDPVIVIDSDSEDLEDLEDTLLSTLFFLQDDKFRKLCINCNIGSHIKKENTFVKTVKEFRMLNAPAQIFFLHQTGKKPPIYDPRDLQKAREMLDDCEHSLFVHFSLNVNLARPYSYITEELKRQLKIASILGCSGVVVHVANHCDLSYSEALQNMKDHITKSITEASEKCPLLLETCARQGTEMLWKAEDFLSFVKDIDDPKFGICIDSCHIFAAGYEPCEFIRKVEEFNMIDKVKLIHLNDSQKHKGCKVDRHKLVGTGEIDRDELACFIKKCHRYNWPMVIEN